MTGEADGSGGVLPYWEHPTAGGDVWAIARGFSEMLTHPPKAGSNISSLATRARGHEMSRNPTLLQEPCLQIGWTWLQLLSSVSCELFWEAEPWENAEGLFWSLRLYLVGLAEFCYKLPPSYNGVLHSFSLA